MGGVWIRGVGGGYGSGVWVRSVGACVCTRITSW